MVVEIWTKTYVTIGEDDYSVGDMIPYLKWKLDDETENEVWDFIITDIDDTGEIDGIIGYVNSNGNISEDIFIPVKDIIAIRN